MSKMIEIMDIWLGTCENEPETVGEAIPLFLKDNQQNYQTSFKNWKNKGHPDHIPVAHQEEVKTNYYEQLKSERERIDVIENPYKIDWSKVRLLKKQNSLIFETL